MITDSFFPDSPAVISPGDAAEKIAGFPETVLSCFSANSARLFQELPGCGKIAEIPTCMMHIPVYRAEYGGKTLGFYQSPMGGSVCARFLEEAIEKGAKRFLFWGSCGSLDREITVGHIIVPTAAYRDEGTSYHYAPPSDYIEIRTAERLAGILEELSVPYVKTRTWTTDAIYRETRREMELRRSEGCSVVEMECASIMAAAQFRNIPVYQFLYAKDCLDEEKWDKRVLGSMPADMRERIFRIALEAAVRL